jgi:hypothetical protein
VTHDHITSHAWFYAPSFRVRCPYRGCRRLATYTCECAIRRCGPHVLVWHKDPLGIKKPRRRPAAKPRPAKKGRKP